jgi:hypothetical protein
LDESSKMHIRTVYRYVLKFVGLCTMPHFWKVSYLLIMEILFLTDSWRIHGYICVKVVMCTLTMLHVTDMFCFVLASEAAKHIYLGKD